MGTGFRISRASIKARSEKWEPVFRISRALNLILSVPFYTAGAASASRSLVRSASGSARFSAHDGRSPLDSSKPVGQAPVKPRRLVTPDIPKHLRRLSMRLLSSIAFREGELAPPPSAQPVFHKALGSGEARFADWAAPYLRRPVHAGMLSCGLSRSAFCDHLNVGVFVTAFGSCCRRGGSAKHPGFNAIARTPRGSLFKFSSAPSNSLKARYLLMDDFGSMDSIL